jgi:hypothetical protein
VVFELELELELELEVEPEVEVEAVPEVLLVEVLYLFLLLWQYSAAPASFSQYLVLALRHDPCWSNCWDALDKEKVVCAVPLQFELWNI